MRYAISEDSLIRKFFAIDSVTRDIIFEASSVSASRKRPKGVARKILDTIIKILIFKVEDVPNKKIESNLL